MSLAGGELHATGLLIPEAVPLIPESDTIFTSEEGVSYKFVMDGSGNGHSRRRDPSRRQLRAESEGRGGASLTVFHGPPLRAGVRVIHDPSSQCGRRSRRPRRRHALRAGPATGHALACAGARTLAAHRRAPVRAPGQRLRAVPRARRRHGRSCRSPVRQRGWPHADQPGRGHHRREDHRRRSRSVRSTFRPARASSI